MSTELIVEPKQLHHVVGTGTRRLHGLLRPIGEAGVAHAEGLGTIRLYDVMSSDTAPHFERLVARLMTESIGRRHLVLSIGGVDRRHFDHMRVIDGMLAPAALPYLLFGAEPDGMFAGSPALFFEWPVDRLDAIVDNWFRGFLVEVEGYVSAVSPLSAIGRLYFEDDEVSRLHELLAHVDFAFRVMIDNDGITIVSKEGGVTINQRTVSVDEFVEAMRSQR